MNIINYSVRPNARPNAKTSRSAYHSHSQPAKRYDFEE